MPIMSYEDVKIKRAQIMQALQGVAHELDRLHEMGLNDLDVQEVLDVKDRLEKDNFKVLVIGEFKRGKSTFINALMGKRSCRLIQLPARRSSMRSSTAGMSRQLFTSRIKKRCRQTCIRCRNAPSSTS